MKLQVKTKMWIVRTLCVLPFIGAGVGVYVDYRLHEVTNFVMAAFYGFLCTIWLYGAAWFCMFPLWLALGFAMIVIEVVTGVRDWARREP
jgi:hypothetical protein